MNPSESPDRPERHDLSDQAVFYVDGGLSGRALSEFELALEGSSELRDEVARAHEVRSLVRSLPRRQAVLPSFEQLLLKTDARPSPAIRAALDRLPRKQAPQDLLERIIEQLFQRDAAEGRVLRPKTPRIWRSAVASGIAAAVLLAVTLQLHSQRAVTVVHPPKHGKLAGMRFEYSIVRYQPGTPLGTDVDARTYLPRPNSLTDRAGSGAKRGRAR
jgi:hypothetical protein